MRELYLRTDIKECVTASAIKTETKVDLIKRQIRERRRERE
jgi:hypothetical protein